MSEVAQSWWWPYAMILVAGFLATECWRWFGVVAAGRLREDSLLFAWVRAVATALIAGIISRLILFPDGVLADVPVWLRIAAVIGGIIGYKVLNDRLMAGILSAEFVLIGGWMFVV
ncbi:AzlD domain-containing protein [Pseudovibrio sp. Tun.PSC04-5.I4]|uniref:AzlD domain-containing protein n=1 Tax=Pseudovibrio sp. Tun.PSC04-5.I4 TaxID=1798213 RepID=UPI000885A527|nr:AzlD domain-containing protein [Pseudovibrio sp. Tun.PSC04-5.I4]SDR39294.1 Branched-chain amino acid transport protein (AzlD) [Pseudovibrio sp. Tun.PSC04-5.I4]